ncbi:MAG: RsmB/NOP family class I SAM-dependent RNA methyltransferase [Aestuariivirga sp.]
MQDTQQGLDVRRLAVLCLTEILEGQRLSDEVIERRPDVAALAPRDRAFLRAIVMATLRHAGEIDAVLAEFLAKPLPRKAGPARQILETAAAQLLFMEVAPHAVVDLSVRLAKADANATHFSGVINGVLRNMARRGHEVLARVGGARRNVPDWCWQRWVSAYGDADAAAIAESRLEEPALDLTPRADAALWAERLGGVLLPTGSIRLPMNHSAIEELPGYSEGAWWVQDAAAAIPARLLGDVKNMSVLDLCAAPGGKTLQLAAAGARVTAVDKSAARLKRLSENLVRTGHSAEILVGDAEQAAGDRLFDAVLLDAPCSATGTIRRHPELLMVKSEKQIRDMARIQARLLSAAARRVKPGGLLVYCTCSLEPEDGEDQVSPFLAGHAVFAPSPVVAGEAGLPPASVRPPGVFRSLPGVGGGRTASMDGFFAARFRCL